MHVNYKSLVILTENINISPGKSQRKKHVILAAAQKKDDGVFGCSGTAEGEMRRETAGLASGLDTGGKGEVGIWGFGFQDKLLKSAMGSGDINP